MTVRQIIKKSKNHFFLNLRWRSELSKFAKVPPWVLTPGDTCIPGDICILRDTCHHMSLRAHHHSSSFIITHHHSSTITQDHPNGRCPFWVNFSSIFCGSRDHLGVFQGSSFKGSRGVPDMKFLVKFWVFRKMSGDPPGGLLGPVGGFFRSRFSEILKKIGGPKIGPGPSREHF